jgi:predicted RNase H-like nuclease
MDFPAWRRALEELTTQGLRDHQPSQVLAALGEEVARSALKPTDQAQGGRATVLRPSVPVLGVDACAAGWVGVCLRPDLPPTVLVGATVQDLLDVARTTGPVSLVAIDIPIGLPDAGSRRADSLARAELPGRASSVFTTLVRSAYQAETYEEARAANIAATGGTSASAQAYALRTKILQVDAWVRSQPGPEVIEVHPEVSFARMAGRPMRTKKKDSEGVLDRRQALTAAGLVAPPWFRGSGFAEDDLLDACAAAWTAVRHSQGAADCLPEVPEVFSDGIPAAIRV